jgi:sulfur relay (sulfurtransferase) DsrF/TusC family protein
MALFCNLPPASPERVQARDGGQAASISGIPYAMYHMYVSAQSLDFLDLAEKCLISDLEIASAHLFISGWALAGQFSEAGN